ncbi:MAG: hypothetical protein JAY90_20050 [Candidatus Thiodiazotropha lotti]|nr:hypothetical protein [Candidatus Thiodiazotropha lotti]
MASKMKKLTELSEEQLAILPKQREKWLKIGLSTEPLDFDAAKKAVCDAYKIAGLEQPKYFYRFQSPYSAAIGTSILKDIDPAQVRAQVGDQVRDQVWDQVWDQVRDQVGAQVWDQVGAQVWGQVGDQVGDQVRDQVWDQVWDQVRDQVGAQVWDQVGAQVWGQVGDQVGAQVRAQVRAQVGAQVGAQVWGQVRAQVGAQVRDQVGDQVWDQVRAQVYGCHDASWLGFYETFLKLGIEDAEKLLPLMNLAKYCGWWAPYKNTAILQDRPETLKFDDRNLLHCEDGPAVRYRDGFSVYSWHGIRIPDQWITSKPSAQEAITWDNLEQRRAACEIVGWNNILVELQAVSIDKNSNPMVGELLEVQLPDIGKEKFLRVMCGTQREFALPVPPEITRASEAQAWLNFTTEDMYLPQVRT